MNKIVSNLRAKTGPQHLFEYNLQNVVKTNNNNKKNMYFKIILKIIEEHSQSIHTEFSYSRTSTQIVNSPDNRRYEYQRGNNVRTGNRENKISLPMRSYLHFCTVCMLCIFK